MYTVLTPSTHALSLPLPQGSIFRINTGAPLPHGADAVIMVEDTRVAGVTKDASGADDEEESVETLAQVDVGENVRAPGSDVRKGEMVLAMGEVLGSVGGEIGTLAFVGRKNVSPDTTLDLHDMLMVYGRTGESPQEAGSSDPEYWERACRSAVAPTTIQRRLGRNLRHEPAVTASRA